VGWSWASGISGEDLLDNCNGTAARGHRLGAWEPDLELNEA
jgi:hypothetical protein